MTSLIPGCGTASYAARDYQTECVTAILESLKSYRSSLVVLPTGSGKTVIFSALSAAWSGSVLVLEHRVELVYQARQSLERASGGEWCDVEMTESRSGSARLVVASVATLRGKRLTDIDRSKFSLIIIDECHHATAKSYRDITQHFSSAKVVGFTATPTRLDGQGLGSVFEVVAYHKDIVEFVDRGWLVPILGKRRVLTNVKLDGVKKSMGDLQSGQLDNAVAQGVSAIVPDLIEAAGSRPTLLFLPGANTATLAAAALNEAKPGCAAVVTANTPPDERKDTFAQFRSGKIQFLCNCQIVTEGIDLPTAECVAIARPTLSVGLYTQMVGRGLRPLPGIVDGLANDDDRKTAIFTSAKSECLVIDYVGVSLKHTLVSPVDLLGCKETAEVRTKARRIVAKKGGGDYAEAIKKAKEELSALAKQKVTFTVTEQHFTPFAVLGMGDAPLSALKTGRSVPLRRHAEMLERFGVPQKEVYQMDGQMARRALDTIFSRIRAGLATYKQLAMIRKYVPKQIVDKLTMQQAGKVIDYLKLHGWRPIDASVCQSVTNQTNGVVCKTTL